jgi:hypothetical protein
METGYYKAGKSWQKFCKLCHNKKRYEYKIAPKKYDKKNTGFSKLDKDIQDKIIYDLHVKISYKEVSAKYKIPYPTLLSWKRKKLIPAYKLP